MKKENEPLTAAQMHYETSVSFERSDFESDDDWNEYLEYLEMGPEGFCEEFSDSLELSPEFVSEYGSFENQLW